MRVQIELTVTSDLVVSLQETVFSTNLVVILLGTLQPQLGGAFFLLLGDLVIWYRALVVVFVCFNITRNYFGGKP